MPRRSANTICAVRRSNTSSRHARSTSGLEEEEELLFAELHAAEDPIEPLAAQFALEAGCRRSEQLRVEWRQYDAKAGTIWLADAKNGRGRYLVLTQLAQDIVEALPGRGMLRWSKRIAPQPVRLP